MTVRVDLADAPSAVRELVASVRNGNDVEFRDGARLVAKLLPSVVEGPASGARQTLRGLYAGQIEMTDDFAAPLNDDELKELGL